jgi:hypothetical protein
MNVDVILASQTQKVPHVGFPQKEPVINTSAVNIKPITIAAFNKITEIFVLQTK